MRAPQALIFRSLAIFGILAAFHGDSSRAAPSARVSVLSVDEVVRILDETVDWYRTLGAQQQAATAPSDLLILYANRQTADKVIALAFEIARANAELLSSEAEKAGNRGELDTSAQNLAELQRNLNATRTSIQAEIDDLHKQAATAAKGMRTDLQAKLAELQGELDMVNARGNFLETMAQFVSETDAKGFGASALKSHIDAIAASIPSAGVATGATAAAPGAAVAATTIGNTSSAMPSAVGATTSRSGIWDLMTDVWRLSAKVSTIETIDQRTAALEQTFLKIRTPPLDQLKALSARGDALAAEADHSDPTALKGVRDQFDTLAWLFKQTSDILLPLSKEGVLLKQYRHNLSSWREAAQVQYRDALRTLAARIGVLLALLAVVFVGAEGWRRAVLRFSQDPRRRYQLLLIQRLTLWTLVIVIVALTFATELSSFVTFAGLLTAGLAVAMQNVLVSVVGYFFLIGKYGIRVGDRVQIGNVTGEVIDLGLVRMHLMELNPDGPLGPTGRVVAFANSIVFQASSGLFKQIPGVDFAWHEITLKLPDGCDHAAVKEQLLSAVTQIISEYRDELTRQNQAIQKTTSASVTGNAKPLVQLSFSSNGVEALVRYPVQLQHEAEIDERVSRNLTHVIEIAARAQARPPA